MDIGKLLTGGVICLAGGVPLYAAKLVPKKLKPVPYAIGLGLEAYGLWNIYKGISTEGSLTNIPASQLRDKITDYKFEYPVWGSEITPNPIVASEFNISYQTTSAINDLIGSANDIKAYIWGRLIDRDTGEMWHLWVRKPFGIWIEVSDMALYYPSTIPKFYWTVYGAADCFWNRKNFQMDVYISDYLMKPKSEWWEHPEFSEAKEHIIATATTLFTTI